MTESLLCRLMRLSNLAALLLLSAAVTAFPLRAAERVQPGEDDDPDLPRFARGSLSEENYLQLRQQFINLLRGIPYDRQDRRTDAIRAMQAEAHAVVPTLQALPWNPIGPAPIPNGQTTGTTMAVSGRVTAIAVDPTNADVVYVGTAQGGVYRSLNGGASWTAIFDGAASLAIGALALAPSNPTILYVGTGESNGSCDSYAGVGLYRVDNADTNPVLTGPIDPSGSNGLPGTRSFTGRTISKILVLPTDPATVFVATSSGIIGIGCDAPLGGTLPPLPPRGIYVSTNATSALGSITFTKLKVTGAGSVAPDTTGNRAVTDMVFEPGNPNNLICSVLGTSAANDGGIYRTTNALAAPGTVVFTQTLVLGTATGTQRANLAINKVGSVVSVVAATGEPASGTGCTTGSGALRVSTNGGVTWSAKLSGGGGFCGGQCFYDIAVAVDPANASVIYLGGSANSTCSFDFKKSTDGGSTFTATDIGLHADTHALTLAPSNPSVVYVGNDGGVWRSTDAGSTWNSINTSGFSATQFQSIAVHPTDPSFSIGGTQDNGTPWYKPGNTWTRADFGDGGFALIDQSAANTTNVTMYHTYFNQTNNLIGFARTLSSACASDGQWSFHGIYTGSVSPATYCDGSHDTFNGISLTDVVQFYAPMALGPGNPNTVYFGSDRLYRSVDRGNTMALVSQGPIATGVAVSAIGISAQSDSVRIVGLQNGKVFATTNGSITLTDVTGSWPARYVARTVIDPGNRNTAYVALGGFGLSSHIWKTTNLSGGAGTWVAASGSGGTAVPDVPVNAFVVDPSSSNDLYAGTDIGVFHSSDAGSTWEPLGTGLPVVAVFDLAIQNSSRTLRAATHGRGVWEYNIGAPLAIQLASLAGSVSGDGSVTLQWVTLSEVNHFGFEVQKSASRSGPWVTIPNSFVPGHGTTEERNSYSFTDRGAGGGLWYYRLEEIALDGTAQFSESILVNAATSVAQGEVPVVASLAQNYPNPFNPSTVIRYGLPAATDVKLEVFNDLGQTVAVLVDGREQAGYHEVVFRDRGMASGTYFYRIQAGGFVASKAFTLLK